LLIQHPPIPKAHADLPQSDALVYPPLSEVPVNVDARNSEALLDPPKSNVQVDPPKSEARRLDTPKAEARVNPPKSKARVDPPKSKGLANSHQSDDQILDWPSVRHLWLDEN